MPLQDHHTEAMPPQSQHILNSILDTFDVPFIEIVSDLGIQFGAFEHKENELRVYSDEAFLMLDLRDPERLLGTTYTKMLTSKSEDPEGELNRRAQFSLQSDHVTVKCDNENLSKISVVFNLRHYNETMLKSIQAALWLTHLEIKGEFRPTITIH